MSIPILCVCVCVYVTYVFTIERDADCMNTSVCAFIFYLFLKQKIFINIFCDKFIFTICKLQNEKQT